MTTVASLFGACSGCFASLSTAAMAPDAGIRRLQPPPAVRRRRRARPRRRSSATPGLWFVPTAEVLADGKWSASGYRRGTNWIQGYTNVADFAGTFAYGVKDRAEIFGSFLVDTRIDRDLRPLFVNDPAFGGVIDRYPRVNQYWTRRQRRRLLPRREVSTSGPSTGRSRRRSRVRAHREAADRQQGRRRQHRQARLRVRLHRQQGSVEAGRGLRLRRLRVPRQPGRLRRADRRVPLGHRRRRSRRATPLRVYGRVERRRAVEQRRRRSPARRSSAST